MHLTLPIIILIAVVSFPEDVQMQITRDLLIPQNGNSELPLVVKDDEEIITDSRLGTPPTAPAPDTTTSEITDDFAIATEAPENDRKDLVIMAPQLPTKPTKPQNTKTTTRRPIKKPKADLSQYRCRVHFSCNDLRMTDRVKRCGPHFDCGYY